MHTRRHFLKTAVSAPWLLSLAPVVPELLRRSAVQAAVASVAGNRALVVIQLSGGNDGLNTVVPFEDDGYARSRSTLRLPARDLHKIGGSLGLHPRMSGLARLFAEGHLAILQGVGCPGLSRDHEVALRTWQTGTALPAGADTGWLGRATDALWERVKPATPGVFVGSIPQPFGIHAATAVVPSLRSVPDAFPRNDLTLIPAAPAGRPSQTIESPTGVSSPFLHHVQSSLVMARTHASRLANELAPASGTRSYPAGGLGNDLRTVAQLIRAEMGIGIYYTELGGGGIGGFDNHANQLGNHCALLQQLSDSVTAFVDDLAADRLLDQVMLLTFSEFGRTVTENGRRGTDHGLAGPMFLAGGRVRGGVHGAHPSLTDLEGDALKHHTDFRAVYATVLEDWLGLASAGILGGNFERLSNLLGPPAGSA